MIGAFQHYLWVLKTTHSGADMDTALEMARGSLDGETAWMIGDILQNRNEWWVPGKIVTARQRLEPVWRVSAAPCILEHPASMFAAWFCVPKGQSRPDLCHSMWPFCCAVSARLR